MKISYIASVATIILALAAVIGGAVYVRDLDNRISYLESKDIAKARDDALESIRKAESDALDPLPPGTIIASLLEPGVFLNGRTKKWRLADASRIPPGRLLELVKEGTLKLNDELMSSDDTRLPDLRGMFLRGQNNGRKDGKQDPDSRRVGSYQSAATSRPTKPFTGAIPESGSHFHIFDAAKLYKSGAGDHVRAQPSGRRGQTEVDGSHTHSVTITGGGDVETRPANVSVYFYIKVD